MPTRNVAECEPMTKSVYCRCFLLNCTRRVGHIRCIWHHQPWHTHQQTWGAVRLCTFLAPFVSVQSLNSASILLPSCHATWVTWPQSVNLSTPSLCLITILPMTCKCSSPWIMDAANTTSSFDRLPCCSDAVRQCFLENHLQLNADKSDVMIQNTSAQLKSTAAITTIHVAGSPLPVASQIKSLGVIIDSYLCFNRQAAAIANKCKYHIHCVQKKTSTFDLFITLRTRT